MSNPARKLRILIVDDRRECARTIGRVAALLGHDARTAYDGVEGLEAASEFRPDVVLMDTGLPRIDGYEAACRLRDQPWGKGITLIALTASGEEIDVRRFHEAGFDHHLTKPVDIESLIKMIAQSQTTSEETPKL